MSTENRTRQRQDKRAGRTSRGQAAARPSYRPYAPQPGVTGTEAARHLVAWLLENLNWFALERRATLNTASLTLHRALELIERLPEPPAPPAPGTPDYDALEAQYAALHAEFDIIFNQVLEAEAALFRLAPLLGDALTKDATLNSAYGAVRDALGKIRYQSRQQSAVAPDPPRGFATSA